MRDMLVPRGPKRAIDENSEASWLKRRRVAVQEGADGVDVEACMVPEDRVVGHDLWELTHEREREFPTDEGEGQAFPGSVRGRRVMVGAEPSGAGDLCCMVVSPR